MFKDMVLGLIDQIGAVKSALSLVAFMLTAALIGYFFRTAMKYQTWRVQLSRVSGPDAVNLISVLASDLKLPPVKIMPLSGPDLREIVAERLKYKAKIWRSVSILSFFIFLCGVGTVAYLVLKDESLFIVPMPPASPPIVKLTGQEIPASATQSPTYTVARPILRYDSDVRRNVLSFSHPGDYLEIYCNDLPYRDTQRTIVAWVKYRASARGFEESFLVGYGLFGLYAGVYILDTRSDGTPFVSNWGDSVAALSAASAHIWHQVAATTKTEKGAVITTLYVDGILQSEKSIQIDTPESTRVFVGGLPLDVKKLSYPYVNRQLDGEVRDIAIYDYALTKNNVKYLYYRSE